MRVFIAVEIDDGLREAAARAQEQLKSIGGVKWVEPQNLHLTLKFLGEIEEGAVSRLANELTRELAAMAPFRLGLDGAGVFPDERRPRVIWIGVEEGLEPLFALAQKVEGVCQALGFEAENRPFRGHLTLGRVREARLAAPADPSLQALAKERFGDQWVDHITMMQSTLTRSGPVYRPLHKLALGGARQK